MYRRTPILFRILDSFFRYQLLFWSALLIVSGLTMTALYARSKTYHASAMTQIQADGVAAALGQTDTNSWISPAQKNSDRFMELIKQDQPGGFLDTALTNAHLANPIDVNPKDDDPRYATLQKNLSANVESANQFSINLTWDNPQETQDIITALQKQYIDEVGFDRSSVSTQTVHFLDNTLADVEHRMRIAEKALTDYKSSFNGQLSESDSSYSNQLSSLTAERDEKQITLGENAHKKVFLQEELGQMQPMSIAEKTESDQSPLEKEVAGLLAQRDAVLATGKTPLHPDVITLDTQIARLERQQKADAAAPENRRSTQIKMQDNPQYQSLRQEIADAAIAAEADQQEVQNLNQQIAKYQSLVTRIPAAQRELADKMRDYGTLQESEHRLQQQREQAKQQASLDRLTASSSLMPIGFTYALPTTGKTKLIAMLFGSLLLGSLVGALLIVLSEWSDHSLRHEMDAERLLGVPILAALPESSDLLATKSRRMLGGAEFGGRKRRALTGPAPEGQNA